MEFWRVIYTSLFKFTKKSYRQMKFKGHQHHFTANLVKVEQIEFDFAKNLAKTCNFANPQIKTNIYRSTDFQ